MNLLLKSSFDFTAFPGRRCNQHECRRDDRGHSAARIPDRRAGTWFLVVLSDIMMPGGVSGLQLAREIRRRYPSVPVLLTTGYVESASDMEDNEFPPLLKP